VACRYGGVEIIKKTKCDKNYLFYLYKNYLFYFMKLPELVNSLRTSGVESVIMKEAPGVDFVRIDLFMANELSLDSEIKFEEVEDEPVALDDGTSGVRLVNFLPLMMVQEMVSGYISMSSELSDVEIANRLLGYAINDA